MQSAPDWYGQIEQTSEYTSSDNGPNSQEMDCVMNNFLEIKYEPAKEGSDEVGTPIPENSTRVEVAGLIRSYISS